jgi:glycosyltransferase involved in cell wall biosynthesis
VAVITGLGYAFAKENWLAFLVSNLYKRALKNVTRVWFLNEEDALLFSSKRIADSSKIETLCSEGVDTNYFRKENDNFYIEKKPFVFLMLTRMLWTKGVGVLAEATKILHEQGFSFECHIIGFFEPIHTNTSPIEKLQEWQEKKIFNYMGFADNVLPFLANADCFVLPSYYNEGVPRSLLEAGSMQIPVITTDNTGCRDVVNNGENGFLCKKNDPVDLADKMEKILRMDKSARIEMGIKGRQLILQKFDVRFVIEKYNKIAEAILGR